MCGRYTLSAYPSGIAAEFEIAESLFKDLKPRYNLAPSERVPVLIKDPEWRLESFQWGLIPSWTKDPSIGNRMINARKETLSEKASFRGALRNQRCLILADGFYEWKEEGHLKIPYYIRLKSRKPFGFAGLWSHWTGSEGHGILSCAIVTGEPNELIRPIHQRMPVILPREKREKWLDSKPPDVQDLLKLLEPYPAGEMEAYPVSKFVNSPLHDSPECIRPAVLK